MPLSAPLKFIIILSLFSYRINVKNQRRIRLNSPMKLNNKICFFLFFLTVYLCNSQSIYVSKDGNDANSGTFEHPYLTISKAAGIAKAGDTIYICEGTYEETIRPKHSGTKDKPIVFRAYENEKVVITAMQSLGNWTENSDGIWKTKLDWDLGQRNFVINESTLMDLARWPNNTDGQRFTLNALRNDGGSDGYTTRKAFLRDRNIPDWDWKNGGSIMFYGDRPGSGWTTWRAWITSSSKGYVNFNVRKNQDWILEYHPPKDKGDYYLEGIKEALDYQNEWYFDTSEKLLYIKLPSGQNPNTRQLKMSRRTVVANLKNRNHIHLENLAFFGGSIEIEGMGNRVFGSTILCGSMTRGISPNYYSGANAIHISPYAKNTIIEKCEVGFGDGTGIWDSGRTTLIKNCYIHDFGMLGSYDAPVMMRGKDGSKLLKCTITRGGRDALQIVSKGAEVAWNDISHSNLVSDDCALLYTIGNDLHMSIHHNWFHDAESRGKLKKAAGIYLDNSATDVNVFRNVVWNVEWTAIQMNWDIVNVNIYNNTLMKAKGGTMGAWHKAGTKFSDVNIWNNITDVEAIDKKGNQESEATWEPQANKQHNIITKKGFQDYANNDFTLTSGAPALDAGKVISGFTDEYHGNRPDIGAYEYGGASWTPGVNWNITTGPRGVCYGLPGEGCVN